MATSFHYSLFLCGLILSNFLLSSISATPFKYCNPLVKYPVQVRGVTINPDPFLKGKLSVINISATTENEISKGLVSRDLGYFVEPHYEHVYSETKDICEETSCPVTIGDFVSSHLRFLSSARSGSYKLTTKFLGEDGEEELTCITFGFTIASDSSIADS